MKQTATRPTAPMSNVTTLRTYHWLHPHGHSSLGSIHTTQVNKKVATSTAFCCKVWRWQWQIYFCVMSCNIYQEKTTHYFQSAEWQLNCCLFSIHALALELTVTVKVTDRVEVLQIGLRLGFGTKNSIISTLLSVHANWKVKKCYPYWNATTVPSALT